MNLSEFFNDQGVRFVNQENLPKAISSFEKAIKEKPHNQVAHFNLGITLYQARQFEKSITHLKKSLKLVPGHIKSSFNLGNVYLETEDYKNAIKHYKQAIKFKRSFLYPYHNMGLAYFKSGDYKNGCKTFETLIKLEPQRSRSYSHLIYEYMKACDWKKLKKINNKYSVLQPKIMPPFFNLITTQKTNENFIETTRWVMAEKITQKNFFDHKKNKSKKIKVGYVSDGFKNFPTTHNLLPIIKSHDRKKFHLSAINYSNTNDAWSKEILSHFDEVIDISDKTNLEAASIANSKKIDILVDLKGHSENNRINIFSYKPSPISINFLGYPGTTATSFIDYIIADKIVLPTGEKKYYSEKIIYLPIYRPLFRNITKARSKNSAVFIFASFNNTYKTTEEIFKVWINILKKVPDSVLWQIDSHPQAKENLTKYAIKKGLKANRIVFQKVLSKQKHLERMQKADLLLDTLPVNGHTTTVDALSLNKPVLTLKGTHFASRVTESCLKFTDNKAFIAKDLKEYEKLAIKFSKKMPEFKTNNIDIAKYTQLLEKAYTLAYKNYLAGKSPKHIIVKNE